VVATLSQSSPASAREKRGTVNPRGAWACVSSRVRSVPRMLRRDPLLVLLAVRAYILLVVMRGVIRVVPLRLITRSLGAAMSETPTDGVPPQQLAYVRRTGWIVEKVAPYTPTLSNCYPQALTVRWLLHRKRIPSTLYYGAALEPGGTALVAHVWIRSGPMVVTGGAAGDFRPLTWYADEP
jgi:hypothetical protein